MGKISGTSTVGTMRSVCVFCGSANKVDPRFLDLARDVGSLLARQGLRVVYGGCRDGMMGAVADGAILVGGQVLGILPNLFLPWEIAHTSLSEMQYVKDMSERKEMMMAESDLFLILPGGIGTLDELFEVLTFNSLGLIQKTVLVFDAFSFYTELLNWFDKISNLGFAKPMAEHFVVVKDILSLESFLVSQETMVTQILHHS